MHDNCCWLEQAPAFGAAILTLLLSPGKSSPGPSSFPQGFLSFLLGWLVCAKLHVSESAGAPNLAQRLASVSTLLG